jgi:hypothetical protein
MKIGNIINNAGKKLIDLETNYKTNKPKMSHEKINGDFLKQSSSNSTVSTNTSSNNKPDSDERQSDEDIIKAEHLLGFKKHPEGKLNFRHHYYSNDTLDNGISVHFNRSGVIKKGLESNNTKNFHNLRRNTSNIMEKANSFKDMVREDEARQVKNGTKLQKKIEFVVKKNLTKDELLNNLNRFEVDKVLRIDDLKLNLYKEKLLLENRATEKEIQESTKKILEEENAIEKVLKHIDERL